MASGASKQASKRRQNLVDGLDAAARTMQHAIQRKMRRDMDALVFVDRAKAGLAGRPRNGVLDGPERYVPKPFFPL